MSGASDIDKGVPAEDSELAALRDGDRVAITGFVRRHTPWMLALAGRILRDPGQAEDVVQCAFANIFRNLAPFEGRAALKTWMHRIVVNQALMALRKDRQGKKRSIDGLLPEFDGNGCRLEERWTNFETPESLLQQSSARARIAELIDLLPDRYRVVFILRDIEELSTAAVATELGLSEANVKIRLHRARAAMKKLLEPLIRGNIL